MPSKFLLWSFGIIVSTFPLYSMPMSVVSITSSNDAQCDLIAAKLLCVGVKVTAAHSRTEIARTLIHVSDNIEDIALKHVDRDAEEASRCLR